MLDTGTKDDDGALRTEDGAPFLPRCILTMNSSNETLIDRRGELCDGDEPSDLIRAKGDRCVPGNLDMNSWNETGTRRGKAGLVGRRGVAIDAEVAVVVIARLGTSAGTCSEGSIAAERMELDGSDPGLGAWCTIASEGESFGSGLGSRLS
ncbi:hypothetical protein M404DRAFT_926418 [Pisolithus tinctorius Marx 270]|uniref:Uncharacterized protein n=1 Tax=Pisolithus tinctorius Marx 270 TaxID=870435 RepID=A0A0C3NNL9_PISTI|nr:hypothetical protein M404DRAFT_926418 [Pisolithus tinctorius Marx 270]